MRRLRPLFVLAVLACLVCVGVTWSAFSQTTSNSSDVVTAARIFPGSRSTAAFDLRDAGSGSEVNKSEPSAFADAIVDRSSTGIGSGTNRYLDYTLNSVRPASVSVTSAQFNYRLASKGGPGSGNACFWFEVRVGGSVIGTHGSYASAIGCSSGNTQATFSTSLPEVTSTDQLNGVVVRVYVWETGSKQVDVDMATVSGSTAFAASYTSYATQITDDTSGTPATTVWALTGADSTTYTSASNWPSAAPVSTKYLKLTFDPSVPTGSVITSVTLTDAWQPSAAVTNSGTLCYYAEVFNGATSLATHGSSGTPYSCNALASNVTDNISLPEVDSAAKANNLVIKLYYWLSPLCGGAGNPGCVKSVTNRATVAFNYYLD
jgi:hypothetical protein